MNAYKYYKMRCRDYGLAYNTEPIKDVLIKEEFHFIDRSGEDHQVNPETIEVVDWKSSPLAPYSRWVVDRIEDGGVINPTVVWFKERS